MAGLSQILHDHRAGIAFVITIGLVAVSWTMVTWWPVEVRALQTSLSELPISFPIQSPEIADYFAQIARPVDIATFGLDGVYMLPPDTLGQKMIGFRSWSEAELELEAIVDQVDWVMYNPEHWELTPSGEQQNLSETVQEFAQFVRGHDLRFMFAPDRRFAEEYLEQTAPYIDAILLQGQRLQQDPEAFADWVGSMAARCRAANPDVRIFVQVGATRGPATEMYTAIQTVAGDIDGIAVWSMPRSLGVLQEFVTLLRGTPPQVGTEATPSPGTTAAPTLPTSAEITLATSTVAPATVPPRPSSTATSTPGAVALEASSTGTTVPIRPSPTVEKETGNAPGQWTERLIILVAGLVIGFFPGFIVGRRQHRG